MAAWSSQHITHSLPRSTALALLLAFPVAQPSLTLPPVAFPQKHFGKLFPKASSQIGERVAVVERAEVLQSINLRICPLASYGNVSEEALRVSRGLVG
jgi:hypothetical protein